MRNAMEEARDMSMPPNSIGEETPERLIEQEISDRIFFWGTGYFEKGMLGFLRNVKESWSCLSSRRKMIRGYGYE